MILADLITQDNQLIATDSVFAWNVTSGCYDQTAESYIPVLVEQVYRFLRLNDYAPAAAKSVIEVLRARTNIHDNDGTKLNNYPDLIAFANGHYSISEKRLGKADPDHLLTFGFPWDCKPEAQCPTYHQFMEEILPLSKDRRAVELFCVYSMTSSIALQKAQIWWGIGNNGKTTLIELLLYIFGNLARQVPLQKLDDPVWAVSLRGALLNVVADLPEAAIKDEGPVKSGITDETLSGRDLYKSPTKWHNTTHHIYACNRLPLPPFQATQAFYRRFMFVLFTQVFKDPRDPDFDPTKHHVADRHILEKLKGEVEGILAYWVSLLPDIHELAITDVKAAQDLWAGHSDNALQFYMKCARHPDLQVNTSELYACFVKWCKNQGQVPSSQKHFTSMLANQGIENKRVRLKESVDERDREYVYQGIAELGRPLPFDVDALLATSKSHTEMDENLPLDANR